MRNMLQQPPLFEANDIPQIDVKQQRLMDLCGISSLPPTHTMFIPLERITIPGEELVKLSGRFINNIALVGIRQLPSVAFLSGTAFDASDAQYEVIMGRRRIKTARYLLTKKNDQRFKIIKCEVYEWNAPHLNDFLGLAENDLRSDAWIQDVIRLRNLIQHEVGMTVDDLVSYGFDRRTLRGRLHIALLPQIILNQIFVGAVSLDVALQITRMKEEQRHKLEQRLLAGEQITPDLVKQLLKIQVNQGLTTVQSALSQIWNTLPIEASNVAGIPFVSPSSPVQQEEVARSETPVTLDQLSTLLKQFLAQIHTYPALSRIAPLLRVLIKELELAMHHPVLEKKKLEKEAIHD